MVWRPARACTPRVMRSPGPSVLAVQLLGMACCKARTTGIEWHMSVSSVKDWRCKNHQFGGNRQLRKAQLEPSAGLICYLDLNQVDNPVRFFSQWSATGISRILDQAVFFQRNLPKWAYVFR